MKTGERVHCHDGKVHRVTKRGTVAGKRGAVSEGPRIRGFVRVALVEPDGTELPSDWYENQITNQGWIALVNNFGGMNFTASAASCTVQSDLALARYIGIGWESRTAASSDIAALTNITSEYATASNSTVNAAGARAIVAASMSNVGSFTLSMSTQFTSTMITNNATIGCIGMFNSASVGGGKLLSLATFATSAKSSNQAINVTYNFNFASA